MPDQSVGLPEKKWNSIFRSNRAIFYSLTEFLHKGNLLKRSRAMNRFVNMERQISVRQVRPIKVDHFRTSGQTEPKRTSPFDFQPQLQESLA